MKDQWVKRGTVLTTMILTALCAVVCPAAEVTLGAGESIQAALDTASPGDTITLTGSVYHENLVIDVPVTLVSGLGSTIRGGYEGMVVHIRAAGTVIDGLTISEAGSSVEDLASESGTFVAGVRVEGNANIPAGADLTIGPFVIGVRQKRCDGVWAPLPVSEALPDVFDSDNLRS